MYKRPRIKEIYPVYRLDQEHFRIGAQIGITKEFYDPTEQLWNLATILDGRSLKDVLDEERRRFPDLELSDDYILDGINLLDQEGFLEETDLKEEECLNARYMPNVRYFSHYINSTNDRFHVQKKIQESTILLLGLGGGGTNILTLLAGLGPRKIKIIDYDMVEEENLGRQFLYSEADIGLMKTDVARRAINQINSQIEVEVHNLKIKEPEDLQKYLESVDMVISAIDEPQFEIVRVVNEAIVKANIPCVFAGTQVNHGRVFTIIPGITGCFDYLNIHYTLTDKQFLKQFIGSAKSGFRPKSIAYGPAIYQLTSVVVDEAVRVLTGYAKPRSLSTQLEIDYENFSSFAHKPWPRYPDKCPTCGNGKVEDWEVFKYYGLFK